MNAFSTVKAEECYDDFAYHVADFGLFSIFDWDHLLSTMVCQKGMIWLPFCGVACVQVGGEDGHRLAKIWVFFVRIHSKLPFLSLRVFHHFVFFQEFRFPLFVVLCHYIIKFLLATTCRKLYSLYARRCCGDKAGSHNWVRLGWRDYALKVAAVGAAASVDIGLSNWSFQFITISL